MVRAEEYAGYEQAGDDFRISGSQTMPMSDGERVDLIRYRFDTHSVLQEVERYLKGERYDIRLNKFVKVNEPILNKKGVNKILSQIQAKVNPVVIQSNLSEEEIRRLCLEIRKMVIKQLFLNYKEWGLNEENLVSDEIVYLVDHLAFIALKRTWKDKEREHMSPTIQYREHHLSGDMRRPKFRLFGGR